MLCEKIYLNEENKDVVLKTYVTEEYVKGIKRDCMLILPGGGYNFCALHEDEPVAKAFMYRGFNCFTLYYTVGERASLDVSLKDVSKAIAHIKRNADKYNIDPERVFVCGFSAGGHLAASIGTLWHRSIAAFEGMERGENRPAGMIISYGACTLGEYSHELSRRFVYGKDILTEDEIEALSPDKNVDENTVPAFIWHTANDEVVHVGNALAMAEALMEKGIPSELHIYPFGWHGLSVCLDGVGFGSEDKSNIHVSGWVEQCAQWIRVIKGADHAV
ncbi:MAG: alpha/beta hydrolase [Clostridia bacterium]|nr:alpha/beta hydrolase [Clostridia bacterium]